MKPEEVAEQVIYKFVKKIYNEECEAKKKEKLTHQEIVELVNKTYEEKEKSLRKKIKSAIHMKTKINGSFGIRFLMPGIHIGTQRFKVL